MRAVVCHESRLEVREIPDPVPGPGHVLARVTRAGICGSDLHARHHADAVADSAAAVGLPDIMRRSDEVVMGHEFVAEVVDYGPDTRRRWEPGTSVVSVPMIRHDGRARMTGLSAAAPGAYAELILLDETLTMPVPERVGADTAAMTEPLAVALHAVRKGRVGRRETAVVIGCGPIGLAVVLMLKARGVRRVVASDPSERRRELARRCGADLVVDPRERSPWAEFADSRRYFTSAPPVLDLAFSSIEQLRRLPLVPWAKAMRAAQAAGATPRGPVVFECVGVPGMIDGIIAEAPMYSRVVVVGVCMQPDTISPALAINKEMALQFVFAYDPAEFHQTLQLLAEGTVDPAPLHTSTVGLAGVPDAFDQLGEDPQQAKVLVDPAR